MLKYREQAVNWNTKQMEASAMAKKKMISEQDSFAGTCSSIISGVISFFLLILVTVFPLIYDNSYFNILETKYKCYYISVIGMLALVLVLSIIMLIIDFMEFKGEHAKALLGKLAPRNWKTTFYVADVAVLVFWLVALISTLQSDYLFESFWGNEGRFSGLFLLTLYVCAYFVVSRFWNVKGWLLEAFLVSGMIMCVIGITDYFQMDVLDFRGRIKPEQSAIFTSTVGNINTYTAYVALIMGLASAMFATAKSLVKSVWYYVCMIVTFFAIIMGCSDNAYLALGALFGFLPFVLFRSRTGIRRYLVMVASFFTVVQCIDFINQRYADVVIGLDSLFRVLVNFGGLLIVVVILWGAVAGLSYYDHKNLEKNDQMRNLPIRVWAVVVAMVVLAVCFALYDANVAGNAERYGAVGNYLLFNDQWGTNRGYIWRKSIELYREFPVMHKLFGYGPDTFGILTTEAIKFEMVNATGQVFDNAHNAYLQYLVTIGPIGVAAYVVFLVSVGVRCWKHVARNPYVIGCLFAVICYAVQALVNLDLPIATPVMWLFLSVGMAVGRNKVVSESQNVIK